MASTSFFRICTLICAVPGIGPIPAMAVPLCKPALAFKEVRFSPVQPETMERIWSATVSVDASPCATSPGRFEILFSRLKENAPEIDFTERFFWKPCVNQTDHSLRQVHAFGDERQDHPV